MAPLCSLHSDFRSERNEFRLVDNADVLAVSVRARVDTRYTLYCFVRVSADGFHNSSLEEISTFLITVSSSVSDI